MLRCVGTVTITQATDGRSAVYTLPITECEATSAWKHLTDTCKLTFPKNIYYTDKNGRKISWQDKPVVQSTDSPPLLLRGDKVKVQLGYRYFKDASSGEVLVLNTVFEGFVSKIIPGLPIKIEAEDFMWKLKQITTPKKTFVNAEVSAMIKELTIGTGVNIDTGNITTKIGDYKTGGETVAEVLKDLQDHYHIESYFRIINGVPTLRCSGIVYFAQDRVVNGVFDDKIFSFQKNIVSSTLEYTRKDDIFLGARAYSVNKVELEGTTKDGRTRTSKKRLSVFVGSHLGEVRTLYFLNITSETELKKLAEAKLRRYYYDGYRGKFTCFMMPFLKHGDAVIFQDKYLPEKEGTYLVKSVTYKASKEIGLKQEVEVDLRLDGVFTDAQINDGL